MRTLKLRDASRAAQVALAGVGVLLLGLVYVFLGTAGHMTRMPEFHNTYYEQLAVAFADGHVDLVQRPDGGLAPDDDVFRGRYWDLSFYAGKLYLYWGPVPALIAAVLLRHFDLHLADAQLTLAFLFLRAVFGTLILVRMKKLFFSTQPGWPTWLGVTTLALGAPLTLVYARSAVYETAIAAGQCFVVAGTFVAFVALTRARDAWTRVLLLLSGTCLALGVASRVGQLLTASALIALTLAQTAAEAPRARRARAFLSDGVMLATPLVATAVLLANYNRLRFGSAFDTGLQHQVSCFVFHNGLRFILPNLYTYIARPPLLSAQFPFVRVAPWAGFLLWRLAPGLSLTSKDTLFEQNVGFLWTTPFYAFSVVAWCSLARWMYGTLRWRTLRVFEPAPRIAWLAASSLALATMGMIPCLVAFCSATRYLLDATAGLAIAATLGLSLLVARPARSRTARAALFATANAVVVASLVVNLALWVEGPYGDFLKSENSRLYDRLSAVFTRNVPS